MVEATAVNTIEFTCLRATTVVVEMYSLIGMVAGITANFGPFVVRTESLDLHL